MAKKLTQKKIDKMFKVWVERQSVNFVAKKCKVSHTTVEKYMRLQDWEGRLSGIQQKAQEKQDDSLAECLAKNLTYVEFIKGKILEEATNSGIKSTNTMAELDKAIRLELLLRGEADSRTETKETGLKDVPTEVLLKMRGKLKGKQKDENTG